MDWQLLKTETSPWGKFVTQPVGEVSCGNKHGIRQVGNVKGIFILFIVITYFSLLKLVL
jgi:hypothetical protein